MLDGISIIDPTGLRDLGKEALNDDGSLKIMPSEFYKQATQKERSLFALKIGCYGLPTIELVHWLKDVIGQESTLEIGAGNGVLANALNIRATDSYQQRDDPSSNTFYQLFKQPICNYGANVEKLDAITAIHKYNPKIVIASWVTHKYDPQQPRRNGNAKGVDEIELINYVDTYVFIGNKNVHCEKPLWDYRRPFMVLENSDFLFSRALTDKQNFIAIWSR